MTNAQQIELSNIVRKNVTRAALDLQKKITVRDLQNRVMVDRPGGPKLVRTGWDGRIKATSELKELRAEIARLDGVIAELEANA